MQSELRFAENIFWATEGAFPHGFSWDPVAEAHGYIVEVASTNVSGTFRRIDAVPESLTPRPAGAVGYARGAPRCLQPPFYLRPSPPHSVVPRYVHFATMASARLIAPDVTHFVRVRAVRFKPLPDGADAATTEAIIEEGPPTDPALRIVFPAVFVVRQTTRRGGVFAT